MLASLFQKFASGRGTRSHRRIAIARTPRFDSLEDRKVPAILTLPITSLPTFTITLTLPGPAGANTYAHVPVSGGNFLGTYNTTALSSSYGLSPQLGINVGSTYYSASENNNGTTYGAAVPNAGSIAWLLGTYGPSANSAGLQDALQAAIWRTEFGTNFELDGVDNSTSISSSSVNAVIGPTYQAELAALANHTLPVSDVTWITPDSAEVLSTMQVQGLVALGQTNIPSATATFVTSSANPVRRGGAVTFSATVLADQSPLGTVIPLGTVVFTIDGQTRASVVLSNGKAVLKGIKLAAGTHTVTVAYIPLNSSFTASQGQLIGGQRVRVHR